MQIRFILLFLMAMCLCSCSAQTKTPDPAPSQSTVAKTPEKTTKEPTTTSKFNTPDDADYVRFPALGMKIRKPSGFGKSYSFHGFEQPETKSFVMAMTMSAPFAKVSAGFTSEQMKARGMHFLSKQEISIDGLPATLVHFEQPAIGISYLKWCLLFGDEKNTFMVVGAFPKTLKENLSMPLKTIVLSSRRDGTPAIGLGTDLPFSLTASPKMKLTPVVSQAVGFTKDGVIPAKSPQDPMFFAAPALGAVVLADKRKFAEQRLHQTAHTIIVMVKSTEAITLDGLEGFESIAEAKDQGSGTPLVVYQVMLFDQGSYILMQGLVGTKLADEYLPEFKVLARSFKRNPS